MTASLGSTGSTMYRGQSGNASVQQSSELHSELRFRFLASPPRVSRASSPSPAAELPVRASCWDEDTDEHSERQDTLQR
jgi:hypothetical protein